MATIPAGSWREKIRACCWPGDGAIGTGIGTLAEGPLHEALKQRYHTPGAREEVRVGRFIVDVLGDTGAVEIQTGTFSRIKSKLAALLEDLPVRLVYPVCARKWLVRFDEASREQTRRRSPRRLGLDAAFDELCFITHVIDHPRLHIDVLLTEQEEVRVADSRRRRGWRVIERRLLAVIDRRELTQAVDLLGLLPGELPASFTTRELAETFGCPLRSMQRACYCLRRCGVIDTLEKRGNAPVYQRL